jgi:tripartite-type tricarboxylate transporter receptor subunit TctC
VLKSRHLPAIPALRMNRDCCVNNIFLQDLQPQRGDGRAQPRLSGLDGNGENDATPRRHGGGRLSFAREFDDAAGDDMTKLIVAIALTLLAGIAGAQAQTYPSRSITLVVPFPPGGSTDVTARIMAERMRPILGQPLIIENVGGAGGSIAVGRVARAAPDGYTIDIGQWDTHVGSVIYPLTYDLQRDFEPIGLISVNPQLMVAKKTLPANDLPALVAWMKANPGKATFVNQNAAAQVSGILLQQLTGTQVQFIPYRGAGPAMTDLISGQVDLLVVQGAVALPQVRSGTIKAIANLSPQRSATMPDIPTSDEGGVPGLYMSGWFGFFAPKGTPKEIIGKLNGAMVQTLADPALRSRFAELGLDVASREQQTPEGLAAFHKAEIEKWWPIIKSAGVKAE